MISKPGSVPKTRAALIFFAAAHTAVFIAVAASQNASGPAFQVEIFREYAERIFSGSVPYSGFSYEYPPLSLLVLVLPRLLASDPAAYAVLFGLQMLLLDLLVLFTLSRVGARALVLYGAGLLLFWRVPYIRHDLLPVAAATAGALLMLRGRALWAAVLWGAGGAVKLYPMAAVPALASGASLWETARRWAAAGAVFAVGLLWGVAAFGPEALRFLTYHSARPAQVESIPGNILLLLPGAEVVNSYGSFNVLGPLGGELVSFFTIGGIAATLLALGVVWWQGRGTERRAEPRAVAVRGAAAATFAFAVFGKVLAWHYLIWPLPLLAMATGLGMVRFPRTTWALYFAAIAFTTAINEQYWTISENLPYFTAMLTARNLLLLPLFALILLPPDQHGEHRENDPEGGQRAR